VLMTAKHLETLIGKDGGVPLVILKRTKDEEANKKTFSDITDTMKASGVATESYKGNRRNLLASWQRINSRGNS
jgi:hypothetical protein